MKIKLAIGSVFYFVTIHNASLFVDSNSYILVTI